MRSAALRVLAVTIAVAAGSTLSSGPAAAATGDVTVFPTAPAEDPTEITTGPDGNLWFTAGDSDAIGRITPAGVITVFTDPLDNVDNPYAIAAGPDGFLWFTSADNDRIGRISQLGAIATFDDPLDNVDEPLGIAAGPDGNMWFTSRGNSRIGTITVDGLSAK